MGQLMDRIRAHEERVKDKVPERTPELLGRSIRELRESGIMQEVLGEGDRAPSFELENSEGEPVRSEQVLREGPMVLSFYRGVW